MAKGILGSKEVRWKWVVGNGVGAQGEGHDGMRVKVQRRRWGGVRGVMQGEEAWMRNREGWRDVEGEGLGEGNSGEQRSAMEMVWRGSGVGEGWSGMHGLGAG